MNTSPPTPSKLSRGLALVIGASLSVLLGMVWHEMRFPLLANLVTPLLLLLLWLLVAVTWRRGFRWWFRRGGLRFAFWTLLGVASVVVFYYTEEGWRGKRAYARLKREVEAKGGSLEYATVIPPAVPDGQNFFCAPGVAELLGYDSGWGARQDSAGVAGLRRFSLLPPYGADSKVPTPPASSWIRHEFTDLAGWQRYFRALAATDRPRKDAQPSARAPEQLGFPVASQAQEPAADVLLALSRFDQELAALRAASARPSARLPLHYESAWSAPRDAGFISAPLRNLARLLCLRASAHLAQHRPEAACADAQLALYLADSLRSSPFLTAHRHRIIMLLEAFQPVWEGLASRQWSAPQLTALQAYFSQMDPASDFATVTRGETYTHISWCDQLLAYFNGRTQASPFGSTADAEDRFTLAALKLLYVEGWLYQDQVWLYRYHERNGRLIENGRWRLLSEATDGTRVGRIMDPLFITFVVPTVRHVFHESCRLYCYVEATRSQAWLACALERYRRDNGRFPETLAALTPRYMDRLAPDPITGQPFRYRRLADGQFLLYSIGWNQLNEQGEKLPMWHPPSDYSSPPHVGEGDWVWRYPAGPRASATLPLGQDAELARRHEPN